MDFIDCGTERFFFKFIQDNWGQSPCKPFHRICTAMRMMGVRTVVVEKINLSDNEAESIGREVAALRTRLGPECKKIEVTKITFLRAQVANEAALRRLSKIEANKGNKLFLGYIINTHITLEDSVIWSYIFESVIREIDMRHRNDWQALPWHYLHVKRSFLCKVGTIIYRLQGSYFCQQNGITSVCAHACAVMMLNNVSQAKGMVTAEDINKFLGIDQKQTKLLINKNCPVSGRGDPDVDFEGLNISQLKAFLEVQGFDVYPLKFKGQAVRKKFRAFLYSFIESRFPALLAFDTIPNSQAPGHVVAVVGHTISPSSWLPASGDYTSTSWLKNNGSSLAWIDSLIIHDDNFGMQLTLPAHAFKPERNPDLASNFTPREALGIYPKALNIKMLGGDALTIACSVIRHLIEDTEGKAFEGDYYTKRLMTNRDGKFKLKRSAVFRPILVKWNDYCRSFWGRRAVPKHVARYINAVKTSGMTHVWIVEVTEPDLFIGNYSKVLDVVLNPMLKQEKVNKDNEDTLIIKDGAILMVRLPDGAIVPRFGTKNRQWDDLPGWKHNGHMPLFRHPELKKDHSYYQTGTFCITH